MKDFSNDATLAQLQGISVELGDIFARMYRNTSINSKEIDAVLEAYKSVRRCLPREGEHPDNRHIGRKWFGNRRLHFWRNSLPGHKF